MRTGRAEGDGEREDSDVSAGAGDPDDADGADETPDRVQFLRLVVGDRQYAVETGAASGVVDPPDPTRVPNTSRAVAGVARVRGETTVVLDCHALLGEPVPDDRPDRRAVVFDRGPDRTPVALDVDAVLGMAAYHVDRIHTASDAGADERLFAAVVDADDGPLPVLEIERVARTATGIDR